MKHKLTLIAILCGLLMLSAACSLPTLLPTPDAPLIEKGSGKLITQEYDLEAFDTAVISGGGRLKLVQGDSWNLSITAEDNLMPYVTVEQNGDRLEFGFEVNLWKERLLPTKPITYTLTFETLENLQLIGGGSINSDALTVESLTMDIDGGAEVTMNSLTADTLTVRLDGGAQFLVVGSASTQTVVINGASSYNGEALQTDRTTIEVNGAADARLWALETLNVRLIGLGTVSYWGSPSVTQQIDGLGKVISLGEK